ncbi:MAG: permease [Acidobacteriota bacterium]
MQVKATAHLDKAERSGEFPLESPRRRFQFDFWLSHWRAVLAIVGSLAAVWHLPLGSERLQQAIFEALTLAQWYAREHVLLCLVPAFFIAGGIAVFLDSRTVMKYLGAQANKVVAYAVGSVSGTLLAVCSCTILPLFAGIYRAGAGLGPAVAFLYSGPAINALAIILTARILGWELGLARALGAVGFSVIIGLLMEVIFRSEGPRAPLHVVAPQDTASGRGLAGPVWLLASLVGVLIFATWAEAPEAGLWAAVFQVKWYLTALFAGSAAVAAVRHFGVHPAGMAATAVLVIAFALLRPDEPTWTFLAGVAGFTLVLSTDPGRGGEWFRQSWEFARQILPLLLVGVLVAGALLGRPGHEGLIPSTWVESAVGGNSLAANLVAAVAGAFMYFATLTEVPILQGLLGAGMGKGPALALLLAGPALSLPNMLVIRSVMGTRKTIVYVLLVVVMATITGYGYGLLG